MLAEKLTIRGETIKIHTYNQTVNGKTYTYYRSRFGIGPGEIMCVEGKTVDEVKNQIYQLCNVHTFTPGYHHLDVTIGEAFPKWIELRYGGRRPTTYKGKKQTSNKHIVEPLGYIKVQELTQADVQKYMDELSKKLASSSVHAICSLLRCFLQEYVDRHEIPYNPCDHVRLPVVVTQEVIPLSSEEVNRLLEGLEESGFRDIFAFTLLTAMRIGEVRGLTWDNIDFENRTISIVQQITSGSDFIVPYVKNNNPGTFTFPEEVFDILREAKRIQQRQIVVSGDSWNNPNNLVFTTDTGNPIPYQRLLKAFKKVAKNMGRGSTRIHDLRHTMLTYIWENTHDLEHVMQVSRHKNPVSARVYIHPTQKTRDEAAALISKVAHDLHIVARRP